MTKDTPNFRTLQIVTDVLRTLNFTEVARAHGITQPAVSLQVSKFEEMLGVELIQRVGNRMVLTAAGQQALQLGNSVMNWLGEFESLKTAAPSLQDGVGIAPDLAELLPYAGNEPLPLLANRYLVIADSAQLKQRFKDKELAIAIRYLFDFEKGLAQARSVPFVWASAHPAEDALRAPSGVLLVDMPSLESPVGQAAVSYLNARGLRYRVVHEYAEGFCPLSADSPRETPRSAPVPMFRLKALGLSCSPLPELQDPIKVRAGVFTFDASSDRAILDRLHTSLEMMVSSPGPG